MVPQKRTFSKASSSKENKILFFFIILLSESTVDISLKEKTKKMENEKIIDFAESRFFLNMLAVRMIKIRIYNVIIYPPFTLCGRFGPCVVNVVCYLVVGPKSGDI